MCMYIYILHIFVFKDTERDRYDYKFTVIANGKEMAEAVFHLFQLNSQILPYFFLYKVLLR